MGICSLPLHRSSCCQVSARARRSVKLSRLTFKFPGLNLVLLGLRSFALWSGRHELASAAAASKALILNGLGYGNVVRSLLYALVFLCHCWDGSV
jgi:hypothetical protein